VRHAGRQVSVPVIVLSWLALQVPEVIQRHSIDLPYVASEVCSNVSNNPTVRSFRLHDHHQMGFGPNPQDQFGQELLDLASSINDTRPSRKLAFGIKQHRDVPVLSAIESDDSLALIHLLALLSVQ
jgi:hypothetical protein